ncbi:hypothetical protein [Filomicrobium sp.]|uniref:hypothetical protein n=1 Tax=Filomicrobium sp. TaxID=2024831 RepID=UPI00258C4E9D|nr:hypothetical protein [Filomicrobium sp.]MCV0371114.1 hypothetical protein [Filomicrobium sp.]
MTLIFLAASSVGASAQQIPDFDVEKQCAEQAALVSGGNFMRNACLQQEQRSYDSLKADWATLAPSIKSHCIEMARTVVPTYFMLNACVRQEIKAAQEADRFQFKK